MSLGRHEEDVALPTTFEKTVSLDGCSLTASTIIFIAKVQYFGVTVQSCISGQVQSATGGGLQAACAAIAQDVGRDRGGEQDRLRSDHGIRQLCQRLHRARQTRRTAAELDPIALLWHWRRAHDTTHTGSPRAQDQCARQGLCRHLPPQSCAHGRRLEWFVSLQYPLYRNLQPHVCRTCLSRVR